MPKLTLLRATIPRAQILLPTGSTSISEHPLKAAFILKGPRKDPPYPYPSRPFFMEDLSIHPILCYSQHDITRNTFAPDQHWPIIWDVRDPPVYARQASNPEESPPRLELSQVATKEPLHLLHIESDDFPLPWSIEVTSDDDLGLTLGDVLSAIHQSLRRRISEEEFNSLPRRQRDRVSNVFHQRCNVLMSDNERATVRADGVIRVDCLIDVVWFGGLSISSSVPNTWVLTMRKYPPIDFSPQAEILPTKPSPIEWDIRMPPEQSRRSSKSQVPPSPSQLSQFATVPSVNELNIVCDYFPEPWPIRIAKTRGITVADVLEAIHSALLRRISQSVYDGFSAKHRERVKLAFDKRCNLWTDPVEWEIVHSRGVTRVDCLLEHTWFAGLSVHPEQTDTCILTLRRSRV